MKKILLAILSVAFVAGAINAANPKREFRGAWMHTINQGQYAKQSTDENKAYLRNQLDILQKAGCNAVIWQVRPSADALYFSNYEPWSRFLSGKAGVAPMPMWDPLQFMIDECHARGMELHAWMNPYRVTTSEREELPFNHIFYQHPERFVRYGSQLYFDPGWPENIDFIAKVVNDIVSRYDVDAIHMDDYFYPYPITGVDFPDDKSYAAYGNGMDRGDWRRKNCDNLIETLHKTIVEAKPWVRFGISPFGIWRNKKSDPRGSETNGLQNYDALYADVLLWTEKGWVDYMMPQLYWEREHKLASHDILNKWWAENNNGRHMYIGQSVNRTMDRTDLEPSTEATQLRSKIEMSRQFPGGIHGNCWWPGYSVTANYKGVADSLANDLQSTIALVPSYPWISDVKPAAVTGLKCKDDKLSWVAPKVEGKTSDVVKWVVYQLKTNDVAGIENAENIVAVVNSNECALPNDVEGDCYYVVTALDRANNESPACKPIKVKAVKK